MSDSQSDGTNVARPTSDAFVVPEGIYPVIPDVEGLDAPFWDGLRDERLLIQRCRTCQRYQWLPEWICHHCHSTDLDFSEVRARGSVHALERVHHAISPEYAPFCPYLILIVELDDAPGVLLAGNYIGDGGGFTDITIGQPVHGVFEHHENFTLLQWRIPAGRAQ